MKYSIQKFKKQIKEEKLNILEKEVLDKTVQAYKQFLDSNLKSKPNFEEIYYTKFLYILFSKDIIENSVDLMIAPKIIGTENQQHTIPKKAFLSRLKKLGLPMSVKTQHESYYGSTSSGKSGMNVFEFFIQKDILFIKNHKNDIDTYQKLNLFKDKLNEIEYFQIDQKERLNPNKNLYDFLQNSDNIQALQKIASGLKNRQTRILSFPKEIKKEINGHELIDFEIEIDKALSLTEKQNIQNLVDDQYAKYYDAHHKAIIMLQRIDDLCLILQYDFEREDNIFMNKEIDNIPIGFFNVISTN